MYTVAVEIIESEAINQVLMTEVELEELEMLKVNELFEKLDQGSQAWTCGAIC